MSFKNIFVIFALALTMLINSGCSLERTPILISLDEDQAKSVLQCQNTIRRNAQRFARQQYKETQRCSNAVVKLNFKLEYDQISQAEYDQALEERIIPGCRTSADKILKASTRLVNNIVNRCDNVEELILTNPSFGDPLGYQAHRDNLLENSIGLADYQTVEELAGFICLNQSLVTSIALSSNLPRFVEGNDHLKPSNADSVLDPRCTNQSQLTTPFGQSFDFN